MPTGRVAYTNMQCVLRGTGALNHIDVTQFT